MDCAAVVHPNLHPSDDLLLDQQGRTYFPAAPADRTLDLSGLDRQTMDRRKSDAYRRHLVVQDLALHRHIAGPEVLSLEGRGPCHRIAACHFLAFHHVVAVMFRTHPRILVLAPVMVCAVVLVGRGVDGDEPVDLGPRVMDRTVAVLALYLAVAPAVMTVLLWSPRNPPCVTLAPASVSRLFALSFQDRSTFQQR